MRVVAFTPYPVAGPSSRIRIFQFVEPMRERGIELEVRPFFSPGTYATLYSNATSSSKAVALARGIHRRRGQTGAVGEGDVVIVHRELAPVMGAGLLRRLRSRGARIVFNFDDAVHLEAPGRAPLLGSLKRPAERTAELCRSAGAVMAGNDYLAEWARGARDGGEGEGVHVMPTVLDTDTFAPADSPREVSAVPRVGWIGTHSTLPYLTDLFPALAPLQERLPFRLIVICNRAPEPFPGLDVDFVPWSIQGELEQLRSLDVGLYPLPDDPWTRGKCGFKAIQYMSCGVPTIASPVGILPDVVRHGHTGCLAAGPEVWADAIEHLLADPGLRSELGAAGRDHMVDHYSVRAVADDFASILRSVT